MGSTPYSQGGLSRWLICVTDQIPAAMFAGDAYEGKFSSSVILNGVLYYNTGPQAPTQQLEYPVSKQLTYTQEKNSGSSTTQYYHSAKACSSPATTLTAYGTISGQ